jgi:ABC-type nitrate/sulfonate/bicarbonate transport system substrate-binding protein
MKTNKETAQNLLEQLIKLAESEDQRWKLEQVAKGKGEKSIGQSFWIFHLKLLQELVDKLGHSPEDVTLLVNQPPGAYDNRVA